MRKVSMKRAIVNRLSRAQGHLTHVKEMVEEDKPLKDVLTQLSAVTSALGTITRELQKEEFIRQLRSKAPSLSPAEAEDVFRALLDKIF